MRRVFQWKPAAIVPSLVGLIGATMLAPDYVHRYVVYAIIVFAAAWSVGVWLTSDVLKKPRWNSKKKTKQIYLAKRISVSALISFMGIFVLVIAFRIFESRELEKSSGVLIPAADKMPADVCENVPPDAFRVFFGNSEAFVRRIPAVLLASNKENLVSIKRIREGIGVDAIIRAPNGDLIARIRDNVLDVGTNSILNPEAMKRPDRSTLIVEDRTGCVFRRKSPLIPLEGIHLFRGRYPVDRSEATLEG